MKILSRVTVLPDPCTLNGPATVMLPTPSKYVTTSSPRTLSMMPSLTTVSFRNVAAISRVPAFTGKRILRCASGGVPLPSTTFFGLAAIVNTLSR